MKQEALESSNGIYQLEAFIRKYYTNELIRGVVLFIGFGLLFSFHAFVEYFLWLKPMAGCFVLDFWVSKCYFLRFIVFPIFKLLKLQKGIDYNASIIMEVTLLMSNSLTNFPIVRFGQECIPPNYF
jgi:hypothetical protein